MRDYKIKIIIKIDNYYYYYNYYYEYLDYVLKEHKFIKQ